MSDDTLLKLLFMATDLYILSMLWTRRATEVVKEIFNRAILPIGSVLLAIFMFWNMFPEVMFGGSWNDFGRLSSNNCANCGGLIAGATQIADQMKATGDYTQLYVVTGSLFLLGTIMVVFFFIPQTLPKPSTGKKAGWEVALPWR